MKLDHQKLQTAYLAKINKICEDCEDKSHFNIPEIISIVAELIESGEYYIPPPNSSVKELCATRNKLLPQWSAETSSFVDELYSRLEWAETELEVFNLRLQKQWTIGSNLYSQKEVDTLVEAEYSIGYDDGYQKAKHRQNKKHTKNTREPTIHNRLH